MASRILGMIALAASIAFSVATGSPALAFVLEEIEEVPRVPGRPPAADYFPPDELGQIAPGTVRAAYLCLTETQLEESRNLRSAVEKAVPLLLSDTHATFGRPSELPFEVTMDHQGDLYLERDQKLTVADDDSHISKVRRLGSEPLADADMIVLERVILNEATGALWHFVFRTVEVQLASGRLSFNRAGEVEEYSCVRTH